jgi:hypothetical protein
VQDELEAHRVHLQRISLKLGDTPKNNQGEIGILRAH